MKNLKKRILKKLLVYILTVVILSVSVGDAFIRSNNIKEVEAFELVIGAGITLGEVAQLCLIVGSVAVTLYCVGEIIDNRDEIAKFGYDLINSATETVDGWVFSITDASGQDYVYGSEALDLVRETDWEVIQGGLPPDDDSNNDDDKDNDGHPKFDLVQNVVNFTALGATWLMDTLGNLYQKWVNGEELTDAERTALEPIIFASCNQYDVADQWSGNAFNYRFNIDTINGTSERIYTMRYDDYTNINPMAMYIVHNTTGYTYGFGFYQRSKDSVGGVKLNIRENVYSNGRHSDIFYYYTDGFSPPWTDDYSYAVSANFPVFASKMAAEAYLEGTGPVTDALNYAKVYREADWLSDDWQGVLIDPLTNINLSLSQLLAIAKQLGLHAIGNNLSPQELYELIKALLAGLDLSTLPDIPVVPTPVPDPDLDPIYFPSPDAHPIPNPGEDPGTDPNPGTGTDPKPGTDPDPGSDPDNSSGSDTDVDMDENDYKVDLRTIFPFCIPFDFVALLNVLDADPVAPKFEFPVVIPALDYKETVTLDMSMFDDVAEVIRICEKVSFLIFLMFATSKVIRW